MFVFVFCSRRNEQQQFPLSGVQRRHEVPELSKPGGVRLLLLADTPILQSHHLCVRREHEHCQYLYTVSGEDEEFHQLHTDRDCRVRHYNHVGLHSVRHTVLLAHGPR